MNNEQKPYLETDNLSRQMEPHAKNLITLFGYRVKGYRVQGKRVQGTGYRVKGEITKQFNNSTTQQFNSSTVQQKKQLNNYGIHSHYYIGGFCEQHFVVAVSRRMSFPWRIEPD
jgi:hypothetical protein